jgi:hypothetical protein
LFPKRQASELCFISVLNQWPYLVCASLGTVRPTPALSLNLILHLRQLPVICFLQTFLEKQKMSRMKAGSKSASSQFILAGLDLVIECLSAMLHFLEECRQRRQEEHEDDVVEEWQKVNKELLPPEVARQGVQYVVPVRASCINAVAVGCCPGIYDSWLEAGNQVNGCAKNVHRSFRTRAEAEFYLSRQQRQYQGD